MGICLCLQASLLAKKAPVAAEPLLGELVAPDGLFHRTPRLTLVVAVAKATTRCKGLNIRESITDRLPGISEADRSYARGVDHERPVGETDELSRDGGVPALPVVAH